MDEKYIVYAKTDSVGYILAVNSSEFLSDLTGWVRIDEGYGDRYHHAQSNYFDLPLMTEGGAYRYKLVSGVVTVCTEEEIAEQEAARAPSGPEAPEGGSDVWDEMAEAYYEGVQSA